MTDPQASSPAPKADSKPSTAGGRSVAKKVPFPLYECMPGLEGKHSGQLSTQRVRVVGGWLRVTSEYEGKLRLRREGFCNAFTLSEDEYAAEVKAVGEEFTGSFKGKVSGAGKVSFSAEHSGPIGSVTLDLDEDGLGVTSTVGPLSVTPRPPLGLDIDIDLPPISLQKGGWNVQGDLTFTVKLRFEPDPPRPKTWQVPEGLVETVFVLGAVALTVVAAVTAPAWAPAVAGGTAVIAITVAADEFDEVDPGFGGNSI